MQLVLNAEKNGIAIIADQQYRVRTPAVVWLEWCAILEIEK